MYPQNHILNFIRFLLPKPSWLSPRPISDSQLHVLPHFHLCPIYLVVFKGSYYLRMGYLILRGASRLDAFSVYPVPTWLLGHGFDTQPMHQRSVHPGPLVLRTAPLKYPTPTPDRDRTVSRRSEPSSRTALMGEQPNPWDLLQPQDARKSTGLVCRQDPGGLDANKNIRILIQNLHSTTSFPLL